MPRLWRIWGGMTIHGIYGDLDHDDYHAHPALSSTGARLLTDPSCPALYRYATDHPTDREVTDALEWGQAYHTLILGAGPEVVVVDAPDWRTKSAQAERAEVRASGGVPLLAAKHAEILAQVAAVKARPFVARLLSAGSPEVSLFWTEFNGVECRARLDWLPTPDSGRLILPDFKTARSAHPRTFARTAAVEHGYAQQADWYLRGCRALGLADQRAAFVFIAQEKTPPYLVQPIQLDAEAMRVGEILNDRALETYRICAQSGRWPGYSDGVELASLPAYYVNPILESE